MATFVLVTGAWHGSWCWKRVREALTGRGHAVFTPTFTGIGERSHLLSREVDLETHIADVMNLIRWEELKDVVLVGHSAGGHHHARGCLYGATHGAKPRHRHRDGNLRRRSYEVSQRYRHG